MSADLRARIALASELLGELSPELRAAARAATGEAERRALHQAAADTEHLARQLKGLVHFAPRDRHHGVGMDVVRLAERERRKDAGEPLLRLHDGA